MALRLLAAVYARLGGSVRPNLRWWRTGGGLVSYSVGDGRVIVLAHCAMAYTGTCALRVTSVGCSGAPGRHEEGTWCDVRLQRCGR